MKILITGREGYIANRLEKWLIFKSEKLLVNKMSVKGFNFHIPQATEVVIHTAAMVHKKESNYTEREYFDVNFHLTSQLAQCAKEAGVKHFIFLSTMAVYGTDFINESTAEINTATPLNPTTLYGKSKHAAENELLEMSDENFIVSIIRPPMVYGPNCPGNYKLLSKLAKKTPIFPYVQNHRSMIFINNLTEFIHQIAIYRDGGIFHPQDREYIQTSDMVKEIANVHRRKIILSKLIGDFLIKFFRRKRIVSKVFGDLTYSKQLSKYRDNSYQVYGLKEAIKISELEK